jgi:hypothetical protein
MANELILHLDAAQEGRPLSPNDLGLRRGLKHRALGLASLERTIARQRARVARLRAGDTNAQYNRIISSKWRRHDHIATLRMGSQVATEQAAKEALATDFYVDLLGTARPRECDLDLAAVGLQPIDLSVPEARFTEEEVWSVLRSMPGKKSPGPDGLLWEVYRRCWQVVKDDVVRALHAIWLGRDQAFECLNGALITLLPKKVGVVDLSDYRPISLVHNFAYLLTKIMARRLAPRMNELVDGNQTVFIRGRCIQDNFLLVRETAKVLHAKKEASILFKVDIAKAFDSISWPFLLSVLQQRGFGPRWIQWISMLFRTARTRFLVNGYAGDAFLHERGLR